MKWENSHTTQPRINPYHVSGTLSNLTGSKTPMQNATTPNEIKRPAIRLNTQTKKGILYPESLNRLCITARPISMMTISGMSGESTVVRPFQVFSEAQSPERISSMTPLMEKKPKISFSSSFKSSINLYEFAVMHLQRMTFRSYTVTEKLDIARNNSQKPWKQRRLKRPLQAKIKIVSQHTMQDRYSSRPTYGLSAG